MRLSMDIFGNRNVKGAIFFSDYDLMCFAFIGLINNIQKI